MTKERACTNTICALAVIHADGDIRLARKLAMSSYISSGDWNYFMTRNVRGMKTKCEIVARMKLLFPMSKWLADVDLYVDEV